MSKNTLTSPASTPTAGCFWLSFLQHESHRASLRAATERWSKQRGGRRGATKMMKRPTATKMRLAAIGSAVSREGRAGVSDCCSPLARSRPCSRCLRATTTRGERASHEWSSKGKEEGQQRKKRGQRKFFGIEIVFFVSHFPTFFSSPSVNLFPALSPFSRPRPLQLHQS